VLFAISRQLISAKSDFRLKKRKIYKREKKIMSIVWQLLVGLIVGLIARAILPGKEPIANGALGWLITALIGVAGAFLGTMIARMLWADAGYTAGWIMSILGAILLLVIVRYLFGGLKAGAGGSVS
jgi:uncharacterized membrane protein YeaQ/YmgE (transglycosylase-associated protein family)